MAHKTLKYPIDVDTDRTHLNITAFKYKLPTLSERDSIGRPTAVDTNPQLKAPPRASTSGLSQQSFTGGASITSPLVNTSEELQRTLQDETAKSHTVEAPADAILGPSLYTILTYIPSGFGDTVSATWADETIALIGSPAQVRPGQRDFSGPINMENAIKNTGLGIINALVNKWFEDKTASGGLSAVRATVEASLGRRIVPNTAKVFKGADGITLPLNLVMAPRNSKEGGQMVDIIDVLRASTIPFIDPTETFRAGDAGIVQFFQYPPIFNIKVIPSGTTSIKSGQFFEYRAMALTSFAVSYSDNTSVYTYFHDNVPTRATLSLQFSSIFPVFRTGGSIRGTATSIIGA